jgi:hypothetical protein
MLVPINIHFVHYSDVVLEILIDLMASLHGSVSREHLLSYVTQVRSDFIYMRNTVRLRIVRV